MRHLARLCLLLALVLGATWAGPAAAEVPAPDESQAEISLSGPPPADSPLRAPRLEPPKRIISQLTPTLLTSPPRLAPAGTIFARGASEKPWTESLPLHVHLCVFLC